MTEDGRRAFEQRQRQGAERLAKADQQDCETASNNSPLAEEIKKLVVEAHRLRENAESKHDDRAALRGLDTALRALGLYGRATGEITNTRRTAKPRVEVVATRDEGIQTAAELLLALATAEEISELIARLQRRQQELNPVLPAAESADSRNAEQCLSAGPLEESEWMEIATMSNSDEVSSTPEMDSN